MPDDRIQPDLQSSLICDDVRQERNGKFMLIGIFDGLVQMPNTPVCSRLCLVNRWCCGNGRFLQRSRIVAPDDVTVVAEGQQVPVELHGDMQVSTSVEVFLNLEFRQLGIHWIEIHLDQQLKMRYPLHVRRVTQEELKSGSVPPQP